MPNHSGIDISASLASDLADFRQSNDRALVLKIKNEECVLKQRFESTGDLEADLRIIGQTLGEDVCYILLRVTENSKLNIANKDDDEFAFGSYVPDCSTSRRRMVYASSSPLIEKRLPTHKSYFWSDANEFMAEIVQDRKGPITDRDATETATREEALTAGELAQKRHVDAERVSRAQQQSGANVGLEIPEQARNLLSKLEDNSFVGLVVRGEALHMHKHAQGLALERLQDEFGPEPEYAVYKDKNGKTWFIYRCPDSVCTKDRMIAASCRNGVLDSIKRLTTINATIETSDELEFDEQEETENQNQESFVGTELRRIKRPTRAGRR